MKIIASNSAYLIGKGMQAKQSFDSYYVINLNEASYRVLLAYEQKQIVCANISIDGKTIVTAFSDKTIGIWNSTTTNCQKVLMSNVAVITAIAVDTQDQKVLIGSASGDIAIMDIATGKLDRIIAVQSDKIMTIIPVKSSDKMVVVFETKIILLNKAGNILNTINDFSQDDGISVGETKLIYCEKINYSHFKSLVIVDIESGLVSDKFNRIFSNSFEPVKFALSPDNNYFAIISKNSANNAIIEIYNINTKACVHEVLVDAYCSQPSSYIGFNQVGNLLLEVNRTLYQQNFKLVENIIEHVNKPASVKNNLI